MKIIQNHIEELNTVLTYSPGVLRHEEPGGILNAHTYSMAIHHSFGFVKLTIHTVMLNKMLI